SHPRSILPSRLTAYGSQEGRLIIGPAGMDMLVTGNLKREFGILPKKWNSFLAVPCWLLEPPGRASADLMNYYLPIQRMSIGRFARGRLDSSSFMSPAL